MPPYARMHARRGTPELASNLRPMARIPGIEDVPPSPVDWVDIPLGIGQEPNANGHTGAFQFTKDADLFTPGESVRRNPDETWQFISRYPERP